MTISHLVKVACVISELCYTDTSKIELTLNLSSALLLRLGNCPVVFEVS
jgi:hypothetical protein